jgi:hypothetical protein
MPKSQIKNWSIGRPLKLVRLERSRVGKGNRTLYEFDDILNFYLARMLWADGFKTKAIQNLFYEIPEGAHWKRYLCFVRARASERLCFWIGERRTNVEQLFDGGYSIHLERMHATVCKLVDEFVLAEKKKRKASK